MSTSGPRYHIPFPKAFLSLNTPTQKAGGVVVPAPEVDSAHTFLSNRSVASRHSSISSVSSASSISSASSSSPTLKAAAPTFITLNSKHEASPTSAKSVQADASSFLSNN